MTWEEKLEALQELDAHSDARATYRWTGHMWRHREES